MTPAEVPPIYGHAVIRADSGWQCKCGEFLAEGRSAARLAAEDHRRAVLGGGILRAFQDAWRLRILERISVTPSGCWEYTGTRGRRGYGRIRIAGKSYGVHRVAADVFHKLDIADPGTYTCHTCDNPPCCNPEHLFLGTPTDNTQDAIAKQRRKASPPNAAREFCSLRGHDMSVTRRKKSRNDRSSECSECRRIKHTEYMRTYRELKRQERAS